MSSSNIAWTRLVRYIAKDNDKVQYGEPILPESATGTDITELVDRGLLEVYVCEGNSALSARPTKQKEVVGKLLGPLTPAEVPIIRCIGLNYKSHSTAPNSVPYVLDLTRYSSRNGTSSSSNSNDLRQASPMRGGYW